MLKIDELADMTQQPVTQLLCFSDAIQMDFLQTFNYIIDLVKKQHVPISKFFDQLLLLSKYKMPVTRPVMVVRRGRREELVINTRELDMQSFYLVEYGGEKVAIRKTEEGKIGIYEVLE
ncbi:MAG: hypothetical protein ACE5K2_06785 [Candidatus Zixiibacteriota bacterium]